jgi:hypothetical protein
MNKLLLLLSLLISTVAHAEWTKVTYGDETTIYIDTQTIKRTGNLVQVTELMNMPLGTTTEDKKFTYKSSKTVEEFDCQKGLSKTISFEWFSDVMGKGKRVYADNKQYPYEKLVDGSLLSAVKKRVCQ